ncbi:MAG TPA: hypothetical protein VFV30_00585 [Novosphingobium sp.]|nr:hypothetical protein [Novosphingobium sp.]
MRKLTTGLLVAASALALAGCEKKEEAPAATTEASTEASAAASDDAGAATATDAAATATETNDPNGNPIKP